MINLPPSHILPALSLSISLCNLCVIPILFYLLQILESQPVLSLQKAHKETKLYPPLGPVVQKMNLKAL